MKQQTLRLAITGLVLSTALVVACSRSSPTQPTATPARTAALADDSGRVGTQDDGSGPIAFLNLEIRHTLFVLNEFAFEGGTYLVEVGETIELWASRPTDSPAKKIVINWGAGEIDSPDNISCGACKLSHQYTTVGLRTVTVTLDDNVGNTVTRTFFLNVVPKEGCLGGVCQVTIRLQAGEGGDCKLKEIDGTKVSGKSGNPPSGFTANGKDGKCKAKDASGSGKSGKSSGENDDVTCAFPWPEGTDLSMQFELKDNGALTCPGGSVTPVGSGNKKFDCDINPVTTNVTVTGTCDKPKK